MCHLEAKYKDTNLIYQIILIWLSNRCPWQ